MNLNVSRRDFVLGMAGVTGPGRSRFDVVVIGAGVFGAWIAYTCRLRGWSVLLLDSHGPGNSLASSGGESRILRIGYGPQAMYSQWALRSLRRWREFFDRSKSRGLFFQSGVLWMGSKDEPYLQATYETLRQLGVSLEMLGANDLRRRYPQVRVDSGSMAILESSSGAVLARQAVERIVAVAVKLGVVYASAKVLPPRVKATLDAIETESGERVSAARFVFACGPWLPRMFPDVVGTKILPTRQEVFFLAPPTNPERYGPGSFPAWIDFHPDRIFYGVPSLEHRGFKIAADKHGREIDPDTEDRIATVEGLSDVRQFLYERFPELATAPCAEARVCQYENTASGDFLIDRHPEAENVWLAGGGSGHGFKHGPAVAEYVASLLKNGEPDQRFSLRAASVQGDRTVHE